MRENIYQRNNHLFKLINIVRNEEKLNPKLASFQTIDWLLFQILNYSVLDNNNFSSDEEKLWQYNGNSFIYINSKFSYLVKENPSNNIKKLFDKNGLLENEIKKIILEHNENITDINNIDISNIENQKLLRDIFSIESIVINLQNYILKSENKYLCSSEFETRNLRTNINFDNNLKMLTMSFNNLFDHSLNHFFQKNNKFNEITKINYLDNNINYYELPLVFFNLTKFLFTYNFDKKNEQCKKNMYSIDFFDLFYKNLSYKDLENNFDSKLGNNYDIIVIDFLSLYEVVAHLDSKDKLKKFMTFFNYLLDKLNDNGKIIIENIFNNNFGSEFIKKFLNENISNITPMSITENYFMDYHYNNFVFSKTVNKHINIQYSNLNFSPLLIDIDDYIIKLMNNKDKYFLKLDNLLSNNFRIKNLNGFAKSNYLCENEKDGNYISFKSFLRKKTIKEYGIKLVDNQKYKRITVLNNFKGLILRDEILGSEIKTKSKFIVVNKGDLIISKINNKKNIGIVTENLNNSIVSSSYEVYKFNYLSENNTNNVITLYNSHNNDDVKVYKDFLMLILQKNTKIDEILKINTKKGLSSRNYLDIDNFLENIYISKKQFQPLKEQVKILNELNYIKSKINDLMEKQRNVIDSI